MRPLIPLLFLTLLGAAEPGADTYATAVKLFQAKRYRAAIEAFEDYRHEVRETPLRGKEKYVDAYYYAAEAHYAMGDKHAAHEGFSHILRSHKNYRRIAEIINREYEIGTAFIEGKAEKPWLGGLIEVEDERLGADILLFLIENYQETYFANAQMHIADYWFREHDWRRAADAYQAVEESFDESPLAGAAQYQRALCYLRMARGYRYDQSTVERAEEVIVDYIKRNPAGSRIREAERTLEEIRAMRSRHYLEVAEFYLYREKKPRAALVYLDAILRETRETPSATRVPRMLEEVAETGDPLTAEIAKRRLQEVRIPKR